MDLRSRIDALATAFADGVLTALREASFEEIAALGASSKRPRLSTGIGTRGGKRVRRSLEQLHAEAKKIATIVGRASDGMRAEEILEKAAMERKELPRVIKLALDEKLLTKKGHKRATTYFAK